MWGEQKDKSQKAPNQRANAEWDPSGARGCLGYHVERSQEVPQCADAGWAPHLVTPKLSPSFAPGELLLGTHRDRHSISCSSSNSPPSLKHKHLSEPFYHQAHPSLAALSYGDCSVPRSPMEPPAHRAVGTLPTHEQLPWPCFKQRGISVQLFLGS